MECYDNEDCTSSDESFDIDIDDSPYEMIDRSFGLEHVNEEPDQLESACQVNVRGIKPYRFEPMAMVQPYLSGQGQEQENPFAADMPENVTVLDRSYRMTTTDWCACYCCQNMPTERENLCCQEIKQMLDEIEEEKQFSDMTNVKCITQHPGFASVCLDRHVLKAAYHAYRQDYGTNMPNNTERQRYTSYRNFVRWIWDFLGKNIRVVLPSCVVAAIRNSFPSADGVYRGFHFPE